MTKDNRIVWVDYAKAILIILVVLGHATGKFNLFIYQFHVAAFFLVSGFLHQRKESLAKAIFDRFMQLILPLDIFFLVFTFFNFLSAKMGIYSFYGSTDYIGVKTCLKEFFVNGNLYIDVLGATWFLTVLFGVEILHLFVEKVNKNDDLIISFIISMVSYFLSFHFISVGCTTHNIDIILVSFSFYELGYILKHILTKMNIVSNKKMNLSVFGLLIVSGIVLFYFGKVNVCVMDIVSRNYTNKYLNILAALNGTIFVLCVSFFMQKKLVIIDKAAKLLSSNTLGILLLHFTFFRLCYVLLFFMGKIGGEDVKTLVPTYEVGCKYWPMFVVVSILGSILVWLALKKVKFFRICLGQDKEFNTCLWKRIAEAKIWNIVSSKIKNSISEIKENVKKILADKRKTYLYGSLCIYIVLISIPIIRAGIMCNDELQTRYWGMRGCKDLFEHYAKTSIAQGRFLSILPVSINFWIQFCINSKLWRGIVSIGVLLLDSILITKLIRKIFIDQKLSLVYFILFWSCLAVSFEHTLPNAFVAFLGIPIAVFICSILATIDYYKNDSKKKLYTGMVLLFISLCSYEGILTLMPIYLIIAYMYRKQEKGAIRGTICAVLAPLLVSIGYLILYILSAIIFQSTYSGNKMTFVSFSQSFEIIRNLILSGIPGYYSYISQKYYYLRWGLSGTEATSVFQCFTNIRVILLAIVIIVLILQCKQYKKEKNSIVKMLITVGITICLAIIATLPISISEMYQNNVGENGFIGLPTSYLVYIFVVFAMSYMVTFILNTRFSKNILLLVGIILMVFVTQIQYDNDIYSKQISKDFTRIENIEELLDNDVMNYLNGSNIHSCDLFETRDALGIHGDYWTDYMALLGKNIIISNDQVDSNFEINTIGDQAISIAGNHVGWYISLNDQYKNVAISKKDGSKAVLECMNSWKDKGVIIYAFTIDDNGKLENIDYLETLNLIQNEMF